MNDTRKERVMIVGASDNPERYSHKALLMLREHGHEAIPVHPKLERIEGIPVLHDISAAARPVDTVTMYVGPQISSGLAEQLIALQPRRVIFNPGSENPALEDRLRAAGVQVEEACTLVLLRTGQY